MGTGTWRRIAACCCTFVMLLVPRAAIAFNPDENEHTMAPPPPTPAIDDHSASSSPGGLSPKHRKDLPNHLLIVSGETRLIGGRFLFSPSVTYSSAVGLDIAVQPTFGASRGFIVAFRQELTRDELRDAWSDYRGRALTFLKSTSLTEEERSKIRSAAEKARRSAISASNDAARELRVGVNASFQRGSSVDFGRGGRSYSNLLLAGASASKLYESGVFWLVSAQVAALNPDKDNHVTGLRLGLRVGWQDAVPFVAPPGDTTRLTDELDHKRWHWQTGMEFIPKDATTPGPVIAAFVRYRHEPSEENRKGMTFRELLRDSVDFTLSGGRAADGHAFVAFKITKPISL